MGFNLFLASVGFRELPWSSAGFRRVRLAPGTATRSAINVFSEIFGLYVGWAIFSFRGLPCTSVAFRAFHVGASGTATPSSNTVFPGYMRILGLLGYLQLLGHPWVSGVSMSGRRVRPPLVQTMYRPEIFGFYVGLSHFSFRGHQ